MRHESCNVRSQNFYHLKNTMFQKVRVPSPTLFVLAGQSFYHDLYTQLLQVIFQRIIWGIMKSISVSPFAGDSYMLNKQTLTVSKEKKNEATSLLLLSLTKDTPFPTVSSCFLTSSLYFHFFCVNERKLGFCRYYCLPVALDSWLSRSEPVRSQMYMLRTTRPTFASVKVSFYATEDFSPLKIAENTFEDSISYVK